MKKPVVIQAEKVTEGCYDAMLELFGQEPGENYGYIVGTTGPFKEPVGGFMSSAMKPNFEMWIKTLEGTMTASYGDYIIKGIKGEFYPCKPDIFHETYYQIVGEFDKQTK